MFFADICSLCWKVDENRNTRSLHLHIQHPHVQETGANI